MPFVVVGAIWSFEEDVCFFVDERGLTQSKLATREFPEQNVDPFLERYFEPIGIPRNHRKVKNAFKNNKICRTRISSNANTMNLESFLGVS